MKKILDWLKREKKPKKFRRVFDPRRSNLAEILHIGIVRAEGGFIVETVTKRATDEWIDETRKPSIYVVSENDGDIGSEVAKIINLEILKK